MIKNDGFEFHIAPGSRPLPYWLEYAPFLWGAGVNWDSDGDAHFRNIPRSGRCRMTISLVSVLRTGSFGTLVGGQSPGEVVAALGEPDAVGGTSGNHRSPSIFLYGTVELWFDRRPPFGLTGVWWEPGETREFRFSSRCDIADWAFGPLWARSRVEKYLEDAGIAFADSPGAPDSISDRVIALANGVRLSFDDGLLYGLHVALV